MTELATDNQPAPQDSSTRVLGLVHRLLCRPAAEHPVLPALLTELGESLSARACGLAALPEGNLCQRVCCGGNTAPPAGRWPWQTDAELLTRVQRSKAALTVALGQGGSLLLAHVVDVEGAGWLLWVEAEQRSPWTQAEAGALTLAGQVLSRWLTGSETAPRWVEQLHRAVRQQRLEAVALVAGRLAHDYGNVFTGILGFTELSLAHPTPSSSLVHSYLNEVYRGAQNGARLTYLLRLFSRRQFLNPSPSSVASVLEEARGRLASKLAAGRLQVNSQPVAEQLRLQLPADLPPVAMDSEHLGQVLDALLDNALEAAARCTVTVSGRSLQLTESDCGDYFGSLRPGPHVALEIADTGPGLSVEAQQRVLVEPFYTTKPRHRGMGLAITYGVLHAHRGGLRLRSAPQGLVAEILIPVGKAVLPEQDNTTHTGECPGVPAATPTTGSGAGDKVLVVDDGPMILNFVRTTLERAGYRVKAVTNAEEALTSYTAAQPDPFRLVLSDVLMPRVSGVDLARQLLRRDANVRVLFMSGQPNGELSSHDLVSQQFDMLTKPFLPDGLLRAVRTAIDRRHSWGKAGLVTRRS